MTKLPTQLNVGDKILDSAGNQREVWAREPWLPECLAETKVTFVDKTWERYCNNKNLVVIERK